MVVLEVIFLLSKILIDPSVVKVSLIIYFIWNICSSRNRKLRNNFIDFKPYFHYELYQSDHIPCLCGHVSGNADFTVLYYSGKNEVDGSGICSTDCN